MNTVRAPTKTSDLIFNSLIHFKKVVKDLRFGSVGE